jgi:hypothetical protein
MGRPAAPIGTRKLDPSGYWRVRVPPGYPLARTGWIAEHRLVLWILIGPGPHRCHHCRREIDWPNLHADHLDHNRQNNTAANLAPACPRCNSLRWEIDPAIGMGVGVEERNRGSAR